MSGELFNKSPKEQATKLSSFQKPKCSRRLLISLLDGFLRVIKGVSGALLKTYGLYLCKIETAFSPVGLVILRSISSSVPFLKISWVESHSK